MLRLILAADVPASAPFCLVWLMSFSGSYRRTRAISHSCYFAIPTLRKAIVSSFSILLFYFSFTVRHFLAVLLQHLRFLFQPEISLFLLIIYFFFFFTVAILYIFCVTAILVHPLIRRVMQVELVFLLCLCFRCDFVRTTGPARARQAA